MNDISNMTHLAPPSDAQDAQLQLPASAYFDEALFEREMARIFSNAALYVGHEQSVPAPGNWRGLPQEEGGRVLVRNASVVQLLSNVCRHRQALMLGADTGNVGGAAQASGNLAATGGNIVCPLHRWTYDGTGELIGAPEFERKPCRNLERFALKHCHGFLYEGPREPAKDMAKVFARPEFDFSGYVLDHTETHTCHYNWKTFIEVYLEDYHVAPFHPGLGKFVTCDDLDWEFADTYSMQRVGVHNALAQPGSDIYRAWHDRLLDYRGGHAPSFGAIWLAYFPTQMIELYPHVLVASTLYPKGPQKTLNVVEFFYPEEIAAFEREFIEAQRAAYLETMIEDDEIAERMDAGRLQLHRRGVSDAGPYQSPLEDGMRHFHAWYRRALAAPAARSLSGENKVFELRVVEDSVC
ncbi:aromatic ring-hydroxylating oxygenase subunit alpha [Paraburkholderia atlantica]|uniref:Rieske (2Fe-2S) iron-sulfur domain protein n=1 Tax=Paraburkholderia atlantica TaxID=2654982 RepID=D5WP20_PARAM|nr:aromatic ring-hydroxylating dioxygenase subunit alpha [Paraburkholderia atlantica]ADG20643.1 Rieske (2Fe-2S) iron-sulfur domain protein [Paraburkholderia atlantica]MBB5510612.1 phenylpropionate dioxygenase-like ring-hydroxylating dioxygenase large terminal subunit [Paraburkholderia atlantica]